MSVVKVEDIVGYRVEKEYVCCDCATEEEVENSVVSQEYIITSNDMENSEDLYFCDRCGKLIE